MRRLILLAIALVAIAVVAGSRLHGGDAQAVAVVEDTPVPTHTPEPHVLVDVTGAVAHPGVYRLTAGSRVVDALLAAGGMTGEADLDALNKAAPIHDGQRIYVPRPGETIPAGSGGSRPQAQNEVNHATARQLQAPPPIGPTKRARTRPPRGGPPLPRTQGPRTAGPLPA